MLAEWTQGAFSPEPQKSGGLDAMRYLIDNYDRNNPLRCRTWHHLTRLLGSDLAPSDRYVLHRVQHNLLFNSCNPDTPQNDEAVSQGIELPLVNQTDEQATYRLANKLFETIM